MVTTIAFTDECQNPRGNHTKHGTTDRHYCKTQEKSHTKHDATDRHTQYRVIDKTW